MENNASLQSQYHGTHYDEDDEVNLQMESNKIEDEKKVGTDSTIQTDANNIHYIPENEKEVMSPSTWIDNRGLYKTSSSVEWNKLYHLKWQREDRQRFRSSVTPFRSWEVPGAIEGYSEVVKNLYGLNKVSTNVERLQSSITPFQREVPGAIEDYSEVVKNRYGLNKVYTNVESSNYRVENVPEKPLFDEITNLRRSYLNKSKSVNSPFSKKSTSRGGLRKGEVSDITRLKINYLLELPTEGFEIDEYVYEENIRSQLREEQSLNPLTQPKPEGLPNVYRLYIPKTNSQPTPKNRWRVPKEII